MAAYAAAAAAVIGMISDEQQRQYQKKQTKLQLEQQQAELKQAERREETQAARLRARAIAKLGAAGVGGTGGSADAVTRGLRAESRQKLADMRESAHFGARGLMLRDKAGASQYRTNQLGNAVKLGASAYGIYTDLTAQDQNVVGSKAVG